MTVSRETIVAWYEKLVATRPEFKVKGKASRYTSMNGHMFSFVTKEGDGVALRMSKADREAYVEEHQTEPVVQYGAVMREYVFVRPALLEQTDEAARYFSASVDYVSSLKPKPTTKPKKKAAKKKT